MFSFRNSADQESISDRGSLRSRRSRFSLRIRPTNSSSPSLGSVYEHQVENIHHPIPPPPSGRQGLPTQEDQQSNRLTRHNRGKSDPVGPKLRKPDPVRDAAADRIKRDAQMCATLLRQMYALDFSIWGSSHVAANQQQHVYAMMLEANKKLVEVRNIINGWDDISKGNIDDEEKKLMAEIKRAIQAAGTRRYDHV